MGQGTAHSRVTSRPREVRWTVALVLIAGVAATVRFYRLGAESLWLDEATSLFLAKMDLREMIGWTAADVHPPLYYTLLHVWLRFGTSEAALRSLSAMSGLLTVAVVYGIGRLLFDRATGSLAALLLALSPFHLWYSQEARMYALVTLLATCSVYCLLEVLRSGRRFAWIGYVLCTSLSLYTHYYAIFVLLFQDCFVAYLCLTDPERRGMLRGWIVAQAVVLMCFSPWLPTFVGQAQGGGGGWVERSVGSPSVDALLHTAMAYTTGMVRSWYPALVRRGAYLLFWACAAVGLLTARDRKPRLSSLTGSEALGFAAAYLMLPLAMAWVVSQWKPMYALRYLLPFLPPYLLLVARGAISIRGGWVRGVVIALLVLTQVVGVCINASEEQNPDWRGVAEYVVTRARPGDVVMFSPGWNVKPFDYYAQGAVDVYGDTPVPVPEEEIDEVLEEPLRDHGRLWLIHEPGHYTDPEGQLEEALDARFARLDSGEFRGVGSIVLYEIGE